MKININYIALAVSALLITITLVCVFVPFSPSMPFNNLDGSWTVGLNYALEHGMNFGRDIIFTFGPYFSLYVKLYGPSMVWLVLFTSFYLAFCYSIVLIALFYKKPIILFMLALIFAVFFPYSRDALFISYPLVLSMLCVLQSTGEDSRKLRLFKLIYLGFLVVPLGYIILIKGTMLLYALMAALLVSAVMIRQNRHKEWIVILSVFAISSLIFFHLAGQDLKNYISYIKGIVEISKGYSAGMSYFTSRLFWELPLYVIGSLILLFVLLRNNVILFHRKIFLAILLSLFLFIFLKEGFVRDDGHSVLASVALLYSTALVAFILWLKGCKFKYLLIMPILFSVIIWGREGHIGHVRPLNLIASPFNSAFTGIEGGLFKPKLLQVRYIEKLNNIKAKK